MGAHNWLRDKLEKKLVLDMGLNFSKFYKIENPKVWTSEDYWKILKSFSQCLTSLKYAVRTGFHEMRDVQHTHTQAHVGTHIHPHPHTYFGTSTHTLVLTYTPLPSHTLVLAHTHSASHRWPNRSWGIEILHKVATLSVCATFSSRKRSHAETFCPRTKYRVTTKRSFRHINGWKLIFD